MSESDSVLFNVDINNYNGPLDVLLDLAKAQKVDLEEISITKLADQFHEYITKEKDLNLEMIKIVQHRYFLDLQENENSCSKNW